MMTVLKTTTTTTYVIERSKAHEFHHNAHAWRFCTGSHEEHHVGVAQSGHHTHLKRHQIKDYSIITYHMCNKKEGQSVEPRLWSFSASPWWPILMPSSLLQHQCLSTWPCRPLHSLLFPTDPPSPARCGLENIWNMSSQYVCKRLLPKKKKKKTNKTNKIYSTYFPCLIFFPSCKYDKDNNGYHNQDDHNDWYDHTWEESQMAMCVKKRHLGMKERMNSSLFSFTQNNSNDGASVIIRWVGGYHVTEGAFVARVTCALVTFTGAMGWAHCSTRHAAIKGAHWPSTACDADECVYDLLEHSRRFARYHYIVPSCHSTQHNTTVRHELELLAFLLSQSFGYLSAMMSASGLVWVQ